MTAITLSLALVTRWLKGRSDRHARPGVTLIKATSIGIALSGVFTTAAVSQTSPLIAIFVDGSSSDTVGEEVIYYLKQDVIQSSQYHLVYSQNQSAFTIAIVTVEDYPENPGTSTAYSVVLVGSSNSVFFMHWVAACGANRVQECAASILAGVGAEIDSLRPAQN